MKHTNRLVLSTLLFAMLALIAGVPMANAGEDKLSPYNQIATVSVPSGLAGGFDISWVDSDTGKYYLADRGSSTASPGIDVIETKHPNFLYEIPLPTGPNGVLVFHGEATTMGPGRWWQVETTATPIS